MNNGMPTGVKGNGHPILPHRDADPIMRLRSHYFDPADFMFDDILAQWPLRDDRRHGKFAAT